MNPGFLLAEDAAVKARFSTLTVSDDRKTSRPVKVFFRYPEGETEKDYPFITIENVGIIHARQLQHSETYYYYDPNDTYDGATSLNYWPSELDREGLGAVDTENLGFLRSESFVPVYLTYQIATYARSALHDRQLTASMLKYFAPFRRGSIFIPEDGTARRFDLLGWANSDLLDGEAAYRKRIFRKIYTIQMSAEIQTSDLIAVNRVDTIVGNIQEVDDSGPTVPYIKISEVF